MAKQLLSASIAAPAFFGLNTQESSVTLEEGYALKADNCILDKDGRLGSRKGWITRTTLLDSVTDDNLGVDLVGTHFFVDAVGAKEFLSWDSSGNFYHGYDDLLTLTIEATANQYTPTGNNWSTATLNDLVFFFQESNLPLVYDPTGNGNTGSLTVLQDFAGFTGSVQSGAYVISAYGRLWVTSPLGDKTTVWFSDINDGRAWTGGSAGSLNIATVFTRGTDTIVGVAAHNGMLAILCKNSVVLYDDSVNNFQSSITVSDLRLIEIIENVGCMSSKSILSIGEDILFLDSSGLRSLGRTIQEKSQPLKDISKNIRDDLSTDISSLADLTEITAVYSPKEAFYLLGIPSLNKVYCFDTKGYLPNGSLRATTWSGISHKAYAYDFHADTLIIAQINGLAEYSGYQDNGSAYSMIYYTNHFDLGSPSAIKIVKKVTVTVIGSNGQTFTVKIGSDYNSVLQPNSFSLKYISLAEYGVAEYALGEYTSGAQLDTVSSSVGGTGQILQIGIETTINGSAMSIQKIDIFVKTGRII